MVLYPSTLPCPQISDYQVVVNAAVSSVAFDHGNTRQRRGVKTEHHTFSMSLVLTIPQLWQWQSWANKYGYDWHYMPLESSYSGFANGALLDHLIRYIGDITIVPVNADHMRVTFQAEMDLSSLPVGIITPSGNWIVAKTPASPATDWIIAKTPASPSTDIIIAGTPAMPAA